MSRAAVLPVAVLGGDRTDDLLEPGEDVVRVLLVGTGNVIRSALAERALRQQFALIGATRIEISSAGTHAAVGQGMWRESVEIARAYGFDYRGFVARQLDDAAIRRADYVVGAAREHRDVVLGRRPDLADRAFTFRELVRILDAGASVAEEGGIGEGEAEQGDEDTVERFTRLLSWADRCRDASRAADPSDDDLANPRDGGREALWALERDLVRGVVTIASAVSGEGRDGATGRRSADASMPGSGPVRAT